MASPHKKFIVITTINGPSDDVLSWMENYVDEWTIVIVGDKKTPNEWCNTFVDFLDIERQNDSFPAFSAVAPYNHYSRKNLGYLYAISQGAQIILETDDDNFPYSSFGRDIAPEVEGKLLGNVGWINVYRHFTDAHIWPRGLPLDAIYNEGQLISENYQGFCPIQQYLVDSDPDVDAIWRLIYKNEVNFQVDSHPVILQKGSWVPFNSQNTLFSQIAFPLLYLPHHVSFRMTDIWRSFVAQAALWVHGMNVAFHTSTARQIRNEHNLLNDFEDEVPGYLKNKQIGDILERSIASLDGNSLDIGSTAKQLWRQMIESKVVPEEEWPLVEAWFGNIPSVS